TATMYVCRLSDCPVRLARSRTQPFQGCSTGSNPVRDVLRALAYSPPRRGGVDAPKAQTGWSDRPKSFAELTTPARLLLRLRPIGLALRASPPLRGGEWFT